MSKVLLLILLIVGLLVGVLLVGQRTGFFSKADISTAPREIKVSNIADNAFTVSWITAKPATGFVQYGESESLGDTASDDRDAKPRLTHHVTLKNLNPKTVIFYKVNPGNDIAQQTTAPTTNDTPPLADPVFGKVTAADKSPVSGAIIYSTVGGSTLLSSYTRDDGNFLITLNNARDKDLTGYISVKETDSIDLQVKTPESSLQKQIPASDRKSAIQLVLQKTQTTKQSWPADLNNDGEINVMDYAIRIKNQVSTK